MFPFLSLQQSHHIDVLERCIKFAESCSDQEEISWEISIFQDQLRLLRRQELIERHDSQLERERSDPFLLSHPKASSLHQMYLESVLFLGLFPRRFSIAFSIIFGRQKIGSVLLAILKTRSRFWACF